MEKTTPQTQKTSLELMFAHALRDIYYAEKAIHRSLPKVIKAAQSSDLKNALAAHREETAEQIEHLQGVFEKLGLSPKAQKCAAIDGILEELSGIIEDFGDTAGCDAAIVFAGQAVEHYEITRYGTMRVWASELGWTDVEAIMAAIRDQERAADEKMTALAEGSFNSVANEHEEAAGESKRRKVA
jgi:ferritin-like metal-binding protein YciE